MNSVRDIPSRVRGWISQWLASKTFDGELALPMGFEIEFLGGPLDGHRETISRNSFARMPNWIECPISGAHFDLLEGIEPKSCAPPTSVAIYDLVRVNGRWRFQFRQQLPTSPKRDRG